MKKLCLSALAVISLAMQAISVEYAHMSEDELIAHSGRFDPKDALSYFQAISQKAHHMTRQELKAFKARFKQARTEGEENMLMKDWRMRNEQICSKLTHSPEHFIKTMSRYYCKNAHPKKVH